MFDNQQYVRQVLTGNALKTAEFQNRSIIKNGTWLFSSVI
jgi:hypothetical protein